MTKELERVIINEGNAATKEAAKKEVKSLQTKEALNAYLLGLWGGEDKE